MTLVEEQTALDVEDGSADVLKRAADIIQRAHDYIEVVGFDISTYDGDDEDALRKFSYQGGPPMCYIGTIRAAAGVDPVPPTGEDGGLTGDPAEGDGPELLLALKKLDEVARQDPEFAPNDSDPTLKFAGRLVEDLGFQVETRIMRDNPGVEYAERKELEREYALSLLRKALTEIYK